MEKNASEIVKLTERIAKDPKSKLFVPLAEEYKKIGDIATAIIVLQEGLMNNPGYITARSFLGRLLVESGDLSGAQKELEEVVKTIPDNLLAQRKLGDVYMLLGRSSDAVRQYKTALKLNPGDRDLTSLVADLEAGKDITDRIAKPKAPAPAPAAEAKKPEEKIPAAPQMRKTAQPARKPEPAPQPKTGTPAPMQPMKAAAPAPKQAPPPPPVPAPEETEIAEEIVELETLEPPALRGRPGAIAPEVREKRGPDAQEPVFDLSEEISFDLGEAAVTPPSAESTEEAVTWEPGEPEAAPPSPPEAAADDINTNTLAELYITQGFYEKAIEIYEGMLAENPGNAGLMQKLARIRAMAGVADQGAAFSAPEEMKSEGSLIEDLVVGAETAAVKEPSLPRPEEIKAPVAEQPESVEMRPAIPKQPPPEKAVTTGAPTELRGASARRKETIDRLESWLKNIMKEKS